MRDPDSGVTYHVLAGGKVMRWQRCRRGLTLIELLVTISIVAIGLLSLSTLFVAALQTNAQAYHLTTATQAAQLIMERARTMDYAEVNTSHAYFTSGDDAAVADADFEAVASSLPAWQRNISITPYPDGSSTNLKQVTVEILWGGSHVAQGRLQMTTLVAKRG
jgi:prepilin-type N-terminal cleavage/methylation domain-containing protein